MPSALSKLRGSIQLASVVVEEGGEAHTVIVCQQCHIDSWQCSAVVEKKAHRGIMWTIIAHEQFIRGMWEHFTLKRAEAKKILEDAARERQEGIQGQWHRHLPSERFWSKPEEMDAAPKSCGEASSQQGMTAGKSSEKGCRERERNHQNGLSRRYAKLVIKWRERILDVWAHGKVRTS